MDNVKADHYSSPELVVMLTSDDRTVENAYKIFLECRNSQAMCWGIKEKGLAIGQMKELFTAMKEYGKTTVLEVVSYSEANCMLGAKAAVECHCDILMGTTFFDSVNELCRENNLKYMPFVGKVTGRPSILEGSIQDMIDQANQYLEKGVYGFDLLGYRYTGNAAQLINDFISNVNAPVCLAGSINSFERLDEVKRFATWSFAIGGAFFNNEFGGTFSEQIDKVCKYIKTCQPFYTEGEGCAQQPITQKFA